MRRTATAVQTLADRFTALENKTPINDEGSLTKQQRLAMQLRAAATYFQNLNGILNQAQAAGWLRRQERQAAQQFFDRFPIRELYALYEVVERALQGGLEEDKAHYHHTNDGGNGARRAMQHDGNGQQDQINGVQQIVQYCIELQNTNALPTYDHAQRE